MIYQKKTLLSIAVGLVLAGCGGGSDYVAPANTTSGQAVDGYLSGSLVVCDANNNGAADAGEATTFTDETGTFTFSSGCTSTIVVSGGTNTDTNLPFKGLLKAPAGSKFATPLTSLMADGGLTAAQVASLLGMDSNVDVTKLDPMLSANFDLKKKTLTIQLLLQQIAEAIGTEARDTSPASVRLIYSEVAKAIVVMLKAAKPGTLIDSNGTINPSSVEDIILTSVTLVKNATTGNASFAKINGTEIASASVTAIAASAQTLAKAIDADALTSAVTAADTASFDAKKNVLSIINDRININDIDYDLSTFASDGVTLPDAASALNNIGFNFNIDGTPIPFNAQEVMTTTVAVGIELSETTTGRKLQFVLDAVDITIDADKNMSVAVPSGAKLYAYGKTASGVAANVTLTNISANEFVGVANNQLSVNASDVLAKIADNSGFADLKNIKGTFNLKLVVSNLNIVGSTATSVQGLSVLVTGTGQSMSGLGVQGKFTIQ